MRPGKKDKGDSDDDEDDKDKEPKKAVVQKMDLSALLSGKPKEVDNKSKDTKAPAAPPMSLAERMALMRKKADDDKPADGTDKKKEKKPKDPNKVVKKKLNLDGTEKKREHKEKRKGGEKLKLTDGLKVKIGPRKTNVTNPEDKKDTLKARIERPKLDKAKTLQVKETLTRPSRKEKRPKLEASMLENMELDGDFFLGPSN